MQYIIKNIYGTEDVFDNLEDIEKALNELVMDEGGRDLWVVDDQGNEYDIVVNIRPKTKAS